jgi:acyl-CoA synthetase (AMP-forming)/AMP-acid ligase II
MLLSDLLVRDAERFGDKLAAVFPAAAALPEPIGRTAAGAAVPPGCVGITFGELDRLSDRVATRLRSRGIGPGDRVAILYDNSMAALVWFWGILKTGAQTVDVPTLAGRATIQGVLDEARPEAIAADPKQLDKQLEGDAPLRLPERVLTTTAAAQRLHEHAYDCDTLEDIVASEPATPLRPRVDPDDVAMIVYTSGTTGRPNGVMLSHTNFVSNLSAANELMHLGHDDSILVVVPLYYIHGRMQLLLHAMLGGTVCFSAGFQFPAKVLAELELHGTSGFSGVPYHFKQLLDRTKIAETPPRSLRYVLITGGALAPAELRRLQDALPHAGIHLAYGQTEAAPRITWIGPRELFAKQGSLGRALPGVTLEILGEGDRPVPAGEVGEVVASGPNIMKGYVAGDERNSGKIDDQGRLRTGDLGWLDEHGHLFLAGRSSEMIKSAGERIFPQEIEDVVAKHPRVREIAVVGAPDPTLGERIVAYVALTPGPPVELAEFRAHCLQSLPFVRVPKSFVVLDELPKTASGKLSRGAIRKLAGAPPREGEAE